MSPYFFFLVFHFVFGTPVLLYDNSSCTQPPIQPIMDTVSKEAVFGRKLYHCLQTANLNEWLTLYPTDAEYLALLKKMAAKNIDGMTEKRPLR